MKIFENIESNSFKISRGYWNVFVILSCIALIAGAGTLIWSLLPPFEKNVSKKDYPAHVQVTKQEIERMINPYEETSSVPEKDSSASELLITETIVIVDAPVDTANKPDYERALSRLRRHVGETFWIQNSMSGMVINFSAVDLEDGYDNLYVFMGPNPQSDESIRITENIIGSDITSTHPSGALTVVFNSDLSGSKPGWRASLRNVGTDQIPENEFRMLRNRRIQTNGGYFYDSGGPNSDYQDGESYIWSFLPANQSSTPAFLDAYFKRSELKTYEIRAAWLNEVSGQIEGFIWGGTSLGNMVKSIVDKLPIGENKDDIIISNWTRLHRLVNDQSLNFMTLAQLYLQLNQEEQDIIYSYVSKSPNERGLVFEYMLYGYLGQPFNRDFEAFKTLNENFFNIMENYGGGYSTAYEAMLNVYSEKAVYRNQLIKEIESEYARERDEAKSEAAIKQVKKDGLKITSFLVVLSSLSTIAVVALFLILLSIQRILLRVETSIGDKKSNVS